MSGPIATKVANKFDLSGNGTAVGLSIRAWMGNRFCRIGRHNKQFRGNQIRTEHGELGELVTVHLTEVSKASTLSATVLIPGIDLGNDNSQPLTTMMIVSKHLGAIHPGKHGALQDYAVTMLKGTASQIEPLTGGARR